MDSFLSAYIETALWSSSTDDGEPLDDTHGNEDLAPETLAKMAADCARFESAIESIELGDHDPGSEYVAHDFWLTRNGHGAGFWDGDYPEPQATLLTDIAKGFGEVTLYVGDDGKIYQT